MFWMQTSLFLLIIIWNEIIIRCCSFPQQIWSRFIITWSSTSVKIWNFYNVGLSGSGGRSWSFVGVSLRDVISLTYNFRGGVSCSSPGVNFLRIIYLIWTVGIRDSNPIGWIWTASEAVYCFGPGRRTLHFVGFSCSVVPGVIHTISGISYTSPSRRYWSVSEVTSRSRLCGRTLIACGVSGHCFVGQIWTSCSGVDGCIGTTLDFSQARAT